MHLQARLATQHGPIFTEQLLDAALKLYNCTARAPFMPAAVAVVLAMCGRHFAAEPAVACARLTAIVISQLAMQAETYNASAAAWQSALAAADPGAPCAATQLAPARLGRGTFVSIPELDEDLDLHVLAGSGMDMSDAALVSASPKVKTPTPASKTLAQSMAKVLLSTGLRASRGGNVVRAASPRVASFSGYAAADRAATPPPPVAGDIVTPRGGESEALARLDYDTSQTLTQFSDGEQRSLAPFALEGLEGLPPPGDTGLDGSHRGGWTARAASGPDMVASTVLSPRDKHGLRCALTLSGSASISRSCFCSRLRPQDPHLALAYSGNWDCLVADTRV